MIGIISDVHGNYPALKAVLADLDAMKCHQIISLGDVCGYYCMINECIIELKKRNVINLFGNHDNYIVNNLSCPRSFTANVCLDFQRKIIIEENKEWLKQSKVDLVLGNSYFVHGGWNDFLDEYISDFSFLDQPSGQRKLYVSGHTHVQKEVKGKYSSYFNPGSVGQPRDKDARAAYAIINDDGTYELKRKEYDIDSIVKEMHQKGFQDRISSCLYKGMKIGEDEL